MPAHRSPVKPSPAPPWAPHCYFVAKDVAECLGHGNPRQAVKHHCRGSLNFGLPTTSGEQQVTIIPESDVYRLINGSTLRAAERFKDWVNEEVHARKAPLEIELADEPATQEIPESSSTNLIPLEFDGQQVRTVTKDGKPYFVAKDVARCLG